MATFAFTAPLLPGKTDIWKRYARELTGLRREEYDISRQKAGLRSEQAYLQQMPQGDTVVVVWETDNPGMVFEHFMKSNDPIDNWFREKILFECHGMEPSTELPVIEKILDSEEQQIAENTYQESYKR